MSGENQIRIERVWNGWIILLEAEPGCYADMRKARAFTDIDALAAAVKELLQPSPKKEVEPLQQSCPATPGPLRYATHDKTLSPVIPDGWRKLTPGAILQPGDYYEDVHSETWYRINTGGVRVLESDALAYIRRCETVQENPS